MQIHVAVTGQGQTNRLGLRSGGSYLGKAVPTLSSHRLCGDVTSKMPQSKADTLACVCRLLVLS